MMPIKQIVKNLGGGISKNSPTILTGVAVLGLIGTVVLAVKATPKALQLIEEFEDDKLEKKQAWKITPIETIQTVWKCYIPAVIVGSVTTACIVGSNVVNLKRNAALGVLYTITEAGFKEYRAKVTDTIGKNKEQKVRDDIHKDHVNRNSITESSVIFTGKGETLCLDGFTGRQFKSDIETIRKTINDLNQTLLKDEFVSLNDLYYELGLESTKVGSDLGWSMEHGFVEFEYSSQLTDKGVPCLVLDYKTYPKYI